MVKVALVGGSGDLASEVIDRILAKNRHEVICFTRKPVTEPESNGVRWVQADYSKTESLVQALRGIDVVLCFLAGLNADEVIQNSKNLVDASIKAGVKRFAPSEWSTRSNSSFRGYAFKDRVREYLEEVNKDAPVLEYTLFQPGLFLNYFAYPHLTTKRSKLNMLLFDLENHRALCAGDGNYPITVTTVEDIAEVVAQSLDYKGKWPTVGGIQGMQTTLAHLLDIGKQVRGYLNVEHLSLDDLHRGELKSSWYPVFDRAVIPEDQRAEVSRWGTIDFLISLADGSWSVSDEWNRLLPEYRFTSAEEYLPRVWEGKP